MFKKSHVGRSASELIMVFMLVDPDGNPKSAGTGESAKANRNVA
jgi:hypothetical protein